MITHKELLRILHYDPKTGLLTWGAPRPKIRVGQVAGSRHWKGYIYLEINGRHWAAHRLIWFYMTKRHPTKQIDHRDRNRANNSWANLRQATNGQNRANSPSKNKYGLKGIRFHKWLKENPWEAVIVHQKKQRTLGCFPTKEAAHEAYCAAAVKYFGPFAHF